MDSFQHLKNNLSSKRFILPKGLITNDFFCIFTLYQRKSLQQKFLQNRECILQMKTNNLFLSQHNE